MVSSHARAPAALAVGFALTAFVAAGQMSEMKATNSATAAAPTMAVQIGQTSDVFDLVLIGTTAGASVGLRRATDATAIGMGKEAIPATTSVAGAFSASFYSAALGQNRLRLAVMNSRSTSILPRVTDTGDRRIPLQV